MKGAGCLRAKWNAWRQSMRLRNFYREPIPKESQGLEGRFPLEQGWDLVSIAFNNPDVIREQYRLLRKHCSDPFVYTVADNSSQPEARAVIREFCREASIPYLSLPPSPFAPPSFSESHGAALNYVYRYYLKPRRASYFGVLDHDIFPVRPVSLNDYVKEQPFYGMLQVCENASVPGGRLLYLWPGLAFFDAAHTQGRRVDFLPRYGGDTGSGSFFSLYKPLLVDAGKETVFFFPDETRVPLWEGDDFQNDMYARIGDDWLHMVNASDWRQAEDHLKKSQRITELLQSD